MTGLGNGRHRAADWLAICNNIADSYPDGIAHGLQKDAIQNAVDAARGKKRPVLVEFEIVESNKGRFFTMTDSNTVGLTGPVAHEEDYKKDMPDHWHWARFEGFAFTKSAPGAIGARGQGKMIFLRASRQYTMFYDTLRADGVYRFGATEALRTDCPIYPGHDEDPWEGDVGAAQLQERCGLRRLSEIGTRVIIVDPIDELVEQWHSGEFKRAVEETWFRALEKKRLVVRFRSTHGIEEAVVCAPYSGRVQDSPKQKVWVLGQDFTDDEVPLSTRERYRVKHFVAVKMDRDLPESVRGIAIVHNGMKITSLRMPYAPPNVEKRLTGYIEFDLKLDMELRKGENQHPNHYDLRWRCRLPHAIKAYVSAQLDAFGSRKLGLRTDPREAQRRRRTSAEEWAMRQLVRYARDLDLFGGKGAPPPPPPPPPPVRETGVRIGGFRFPDPNIAPRVNWGHRFEGIEVAAYTCRRGSRDLILTCAVFHANNQVLTVVRGQEFPLFAGKGVSFGPFDIAIDRQTFSEPGEYRIKATLYDALTRVEIHRVARRFWVEAEPPLRAPFTLEPVSGFPDVYKTRQWLTSGSINNSPVLHYNTAHPAYLRVEADEDAQADYLFAICLEGAMNFVLNRPVDSEGNVDYHPLERKAILGNGKQADAVDLPANTYEEIARYVSDVRWRLLEEG